MIELLLLLIVIIMLIGPDPTLGLLWYGGVFTLAASILVGIVVGIFYAVVIFILWGYYH